MEIGNGSLWKDFARKPAEYFPNRLLGPPETVALPRRDGLLLALLLLCLALRMWMAHRWQILWPDAVDYIHVSKAVARGDPEPLVNAVRAEHLSHHSGVATRGRVELGSGGPMVERGDG